MPPTHRSMLRLLAALLLVLVTASCSPQAPQLSSEQTSKALDQGLQSAEATVASFSESDAAKAIAVIASGLVIGSPPMMLELADAERIVKHVHSDHDLDRDSYELDDSGGFPSWTSTGPSSSGNLEYHWSQGSEERQARLVLDWEALQSTVVANSPSPSDSSTYEVPRGLRAVLSLAGTVVGQAEARLAYFSSSACGTTTDPTSLSLDGSLGLPGDQLTVAADFVLAAAGGTGSISTEGEIDLVSDGETAGVDWNIVLRGPIERVDCVMQPFTPTGAAFALGGYAGDQRAALVFSIDDLDRDEATGMRSFELSGSSTIDGRLAVTFAGTFDDADGDGVPGENLVLTFAGGETMTLEAFIRISHPLGATALRLLSALD